MGKLGISIYEEKSTQEEIFNYIDLAKKYGFSRIFSCLLSVNGTKENIAKKFIDINSYAKDRGFEIILDVNPGVFKKLGVSYFDLSFFKEIKADGIRLDIGFTGLEESLMTFNKEGLKIEINMSNNTHYLDTIMDYMPNKENLIGCHNFYPHRHSGLNYEHYKSCIENFKRHGLRTAAFIASNTENSFGPWPTTEGLPTLEMHRGIPIDIQAKHIIATGGIDDIIISNCYASEEEFESLARMRNDMVTFDVILNKNTPETERKILFEDIHFKRGDFSDKIIRSSQSRIKYKEHNFEIYNTPKEIKKGDIIIESSEYKNYSGELEIALEDFQNNGKSNVVGRIREEELFMLDCLRAYQKFNFRLCDEE